MIGIDIEQVRRFDADKGDVMTRIIFTQNEVNYCKSKKEPEQHFAARFAAKEAIIKALNLKEIDMIDIEILNGDDGKPYVILRGEKRPDIRISLSHTADTAIAVAIKEVIK